MSQGFGGESPRPHHQTTHQKPARFLVLIDSGGNAIARLFLDTHQQIGQFDASTEEVTQMTAGLVPSAGTGPEWDSALAGHSAAERSGAEVYTLDV